MSVNGTEELEVGRWIKRQVEAELGDSISGAWLDVIPEGAKLPAVKFNAQTRNDVQTVGQHIVMSRFTFQVVATVEGNSVKLLPDFAERIFDALHKKNGTSNGVRILACTRKEPWTMPDVQQSHVYRSAGGMYEVFAQSLE